MSPIKSNSVPSVSRAVGLVRALIQSSRFRTFLAGLVTGITCLIPVNAESFNLNGAVGSVASTLPIHSPSFNSLLGGSVASLAAPSGAVVAIGTSTGQYSVTPTGGASYTIPISVPPGTAGLEPKLSLRYSSQGGNGLLGLGWSLSGLSNITRCPETIAQDGEIHGVSFDSKDKLCLDGQRLTAISGVYGLSSTEYRTEIDSFTRITQSGDINGMGTTYEARTKSGLVYTYGSSVGSGTNSSFLAPGRAETYVWAVDRIGDSVGNYIQIYYGVDAGTHETYIDRIEYTGNTTAGLSPYNSVRFVYEVGTRPDIVERYIPNGGAVQMKVTRRVSIVQTYAGSTMVREYRLGYDSGTASQKSRLTSLTECAYDSSTAYCLPSTTFDWQEKTAGFNASSPDDDLPGHHELTNGNDPLAELVDVNGDGLADFVEANTSLGAPTTYLRLPAGVWSSGQSGGGYGLNAQLYSGGKTLAELVDLNGDGLPDEIVDASGQTLRAYLNTGSGWSLDSSYTPPAILFNSNGGRVGQFVDLNGDGLPDIVTTNTSGAMVAYLNTPSLNSGSHWQATISYNPPFAIYPSSGVRGDLVDINGDGLPDLVVSYKENTDDPNGYATYLNTGTGWSARLVGYHTPDAVHVFGASYAEYVDVNGDGLVDIVESGQSSNDNAGSRVATYINTGNRDTTGNLWVRDNRYDTPVISFTRTIADASDKSGLLADVNGDGLPDLVVAVDNVPSGSTRLTYINRGNSNCSTQYCKWIRDDSYQMPSSLFSSHGAVFGTIADLTGDGQPDTAFTLHHIFYSQSNTPDLLTKITNGLGAQILTGYNALTAVSPTLPSVYTRSLGTYPEHSVIGPMMVVTSHSASDGLGGFRTVDYQYSNLMSNQLGRGLLGFQLVRDTDLVSGNIETTNYQTTFPYTGMTTSAVLVDAAGETLQTTSNNIFAQTASCGNGGTPFPFVGGSTSQSYEIGSSEGVVKTQTTNTVYGDGCGNPTQITVSTVAGSGGTTDQHVTSTVNTYNNDTSNWFLARLNQTQVTNTIPGGPSLTRTSSFSYSPLNGLLVQENIEAGSSTLAMSTTYGYDGYGNKTSVRLSGSGVTSRTTTTVYDIRGQFPLRGTNALLQTESYVYDPRHGGRTSLTGPNNLTTNWTYDPFGRAMQEARADGTATVTAYGNCDSTCPSNGVMQIGTASTDGTYSVKVLDVLERPVDQIKRGFNGNLVHQNTYYDALGRVAQTSVPHYAGNPDYHTTFTYDALNRVIQQSAPLNDSTSSGRITGISYAGLRTTATDPNNHATTKLVNVIGQTVSVTDAQNGTVSYAYDAFGDLVQTTDPAGNKITMSYDIRGRKISMTDPDMGTWNYNYDSYGELVYQADAKGQGSTMIYDALGRMIQRNELDDVSTWTYDTTWKGALSLVVLAPSTGPGYQQSYAYDSLGRQNQSLTTIEGQSYYVKTAYDSQSRVSVLTYPDGFKTQYNYHPQFGYLQSVTDPANSGKVFWTLNDFDAYGNVDMETAGNGVQTNRPYQQSRNLVDSIFSSTSGGATVQNLEYRWDAVNNLLSRKDNRQGGTIEAFTYDPLNRLTRSTLNGGTNQSLAYDTIGNITSKQDVGSYVYNSHSHPHEVALTAGPIPTLFLYDKNGNMTSSSGRLVSYTSYNLPNDIQEVVPNNPAALLTYIGTFLQGLLASGTVLANRSQLYYAPDRSRFKQVESRVGGPPQTRNTIYIGDFYERNELGTSVNDTHYIKAYGKVVAINTFYHNSAASQTHYLHLDHLGSTDTITDEVGNIVERLSYDAFGKRRTSDWNIDTNETLLYSTIHDTTRGFTGHEHLDEVALIHMNGRVQDPVFGRMLSPDVFVQFPENTQGFNRYTYVNNNPLSYTDPSGHVLAFDDALYLAIALIAAGEVTHTPVLTQVGFVILPIPGGYAAAVLKGFAGGLVASNGDIRQGVVGALTAGVFQGVGDAFADGGSLSTTFGSSGSFGYYIAKVVTHGIVGGVSSELSGGSFKSGFIGAGFAQAASPAIEGTFGTSSALAPVRIVAAAVIGGTASELGGGKFANGAVTAAFGRAFNDELHPRQIIDSTADAVKHYFEGNGEQVELGPNTKEALTTSPEQQARSQRIRTGQTSSLSGDYGVDLTYDVYHVGHTGVQYDTVCNSGACTTTYTGFTRKLPGGGYGSDGFWDIRPGSNDTMGAQGELPGGHPYPYTPYRWSETYSNPYH